MTFLALRDQFWRERVFKPFLKRVDSCDMQIAASTIGYTTHYLHLRNVQVEQDVLPASRDAKPAVDQSAPGSLLNAAPGPLENRLSNELDPYWAQVKRVLEEYLQRSLRTSAEARSDCPPSSHDVVANTTHHSNSQMLALEATAVAVNESASEQVKVRLEEKEVSRVGMVANLTLTDGRKIAVQLSEEMSREQRLTLKMTRGEAQKLLDPLVINFGGPVRLSEKTTQFDINADGELDTIATLASPSYFLALDKNNDGNINDGSELFGALTGDGFAELRNYDEDGNGFIDAGDAVFGQLLIFRPGSELQKLTQTSVAAIALQSVYTPFSLQSNTGAVLGQVRQTGFYVTEQGAGTVQQIDLAI